MANDQRVRPIRLHNLAVVIGAAAMFSLACNSSAMAEHFSLDGTIWQETGSAVGVDPYLLYAVAIAESSIKSGERQVRPHKYAIRTPHGSFYPPTKLEAVRILRRLSPAEALQSDIGLMQINYGSHRKKTTDITDLLDPRTNIRIGAGVLKYSIESYPRNTVIAIGRYNAWQDLTRAKSYGHRVLFIRGELHKLADREGVR